MTLQSEVEGKASETRHLVLKTSDKHSPLHSLGGASSSLTSLLQGGGFGLPTSHAKDIELPQACCFGITLKG